MAERSHPLQGNRRITKMSAHTGDPGTGAVLQSARIAYRRGQCGDGGCAGDGML